MLAQMPEPITPPSPQPVYDPPPNDIPPMEVPPGSDPLPTPIPARL